MRLKQKLFVKNDCMKDGRWMSYPKGIMVHSTGANNPNVARYVDLGVYKNHFDQPNTTKAVHAFIGKDLDGLVSTYQTMPWLKRAWHCYQGPKGSGNNTHISFEVCEDSLTDQSYFNAVYQEAVDLCVYLCREYGFDPLADGVIISHHEGYLRGIASNHADIDHWFKRFNVSMDIFRQDVYNTLREKEMEMDYRQFSEFMDRWLSEQQAKKADTWAEPSILLCTEKKILEDAGGGTMKYPQGLVRRQELAVTMANLFNALKEEH